MADNDFPHECRVKLREFAQDAIASLGGLLDEMIGMAGFKVVIRLTEVALAVRLKNAGVPVDKLPAGEIRKAVQHALAQLRPATDELPFDCAKLIDWQGANAVRDVLRNQCRTRRRAKLKEWPGREGARHG